MGVRIDFSDDIAKVENWLYALAKLVGRQTLPEAVTATLRNEIAQWPAWRIQRWIEAVVVTTCREVLSWMPSLSDDKRQQCCQRVVTPRDAAEIQKDGLAAQPTVTSTAAKTALGMIAEAARMVLRAEQACPNCTVMWVALDWTTAAVKFATLDALDQGARYNHDALFNRYMDVLVVVATSLDAFSRGAEHERREIAQRKASLEG